MTAVYAANGKRDFHEFERMFDARIEQLQQTTWEFDENRRLVLRYIAECRRGMVKSGGRNRRVAKSTLYRIVGILELLSESWIRKPFPQCTAEDWRNFYIRMEDGEILSQSGKPFLQSSRAKNYKTVQKFLRWIGQEEFCDNWDTREDSRTKQIVTRKEVEQMAEASTPAISCFLWMLFDGGFRAEEFANLRWMDLKKKDGKGYYQAQVRAETSKTKKGRVVSLWLATDAIDRLRRELERSGNFEPSQFLYAGKYHSLLKAVKRLGRRVLERDISPHVLRHSSASYYANIIKTYQNFCFRYGWSLKSGIAQRYWHPTTDDEIADQAQEHEIGRFRNDFERMKIERGALSEEVQRLRHELEQFKSAVFDHFIRSGEADRLHELITQHDSAESVPPAEPTLRTEAISGRQSP